MNVQHGNRVRALACALAAVTVAVTWPAARGMAAGVRPPGAGDASATGAARRAGSWGKAIGVPGLGALNKGGDPWVLVSCASAGNCAAAGDYTAGHAPRRGFVASERNGVWGKAIEVPGLGALGGYAEVSSVSCASAGSCAVGGSYADGHGDQGFVAVEKDGVWGKAVEVPGLGALNTGAGAGVVSVSCASAGNCAAGGSYSDRREHLQGFVAVERNGVWGKAVEVPGLGALNKGGSASVSSVSCGSAGSCVAGGDYGEPHAQGFVAVEKNGVWGAAVGVPGLAALNTGRFAEVKSVSCASAGSCAAGGDYLAGTGKSRGFVVSEKNGRWGTAIEVPGLAALNTGTAGVVSVSCGSAGSCAAGGSYEYRRGVQGFVAAERNGVWGKAIEVPGLGALNKGLAFVFSVSCAPAGNCAAGGGYTGRRGSEQGFVVSQQHGRWGTAIEVPGLGALNKGDADVTEVSCAPPGRCAAAGSYTDRRYRFRGFVVSQTG